MYAGHERSITSPVDGLAVGNGHGTDGTAMEAALEGDDVGPSGSVAGQLDRTFDRFSATVAEEELVQALGHHGLEFLSEL